MFRTSPQEGVDTSQSHLRASENVGVPPPPPSLVTGDQDAEGQATCLGISVRKMFSGPFGAHRPGSLSWHLSAAAVVQGGRDPLETCP